MKIEGESVTFERWDMGFVQKFGPVEGADMVLAFRDFNPGLPFLYDPHQLAHFLGVGRKRLFDTLRYIDREYRTTNIKKKSGGGRTLQVPSRRLKELQSRILREILACFPPSPYATAYKKGASLTGNAAPHVGKRYLLKLDITDFFGSIRFDQVYRAVFNASRFPKQIGLMLTRLCCRREVLPQGAPTSPALSNLVMRRFDDHMGTWCAGRGVSYTRYCDDMTFSSDRPLYPVYEKARSMLEEMGFQLNGKKTRFVTDAGRQSVTGLTVNEKLSVPREEKRRLRQEIYYTLKFGPDSAMYRSEAWADRAREPHHGRAMTGERYLMHLQGRAAFVLQVEPENRWFRAAAEKLSALQRQCRAEGG